MRILASLLLCWVTSVAAAEDRAISAAETAYAKGDYATAVEKWSEEALKEGVTAGRLSALGNAEWRLGRKGRAMVCWERALLLDPRDPVALAGIALAVKVLPVFFFNAWNAICCSLILRPETWALAV